MNHCTNVTRFKIFVILVHPKICLCVAVEVILRDCLYEEIYTWYLVLSRANKLGPNSVFRGDVTWKYHGGVAVCSMELENIRSF